MTGEGAKVGDNAIMLVPNPLYREVTLPIIIGIEKNHAEDREDAESICLNPCGLSDLSVKLMHYFVLLRLFAETKKPLHL